jgi:hypothetical protein
MGFQNSFMVRAKLTEKEKEKGKERTKNKSKTISCC